MIPAEEIIQKVGKKEFQKMATNQQRGQRMVDIKNLRRWGKGDVWFRICEHGNVTIRKGEPTKDCKPCLKSTGVTKLRDFEEHFNLGIGGYVTSKRDMKESAKKLGLVPIGSDGI